jgi:hypothetical protein
MKQPMDHLKSKKTPSRKTVYIAGDNELAEEVAALEEEVRRLRLAVELRHDTADTARLLPLETKLAEKRKALEDGAIKFVFQSIKRRRYDELINEHPPTAEQIKEAEADKIEISFNPETLPQQMIIECMVEPYVGPELDEEQRAELTDWLDSDAWNTQEIMTLYQACLMVNNSSKVVSMGKG